MSPNQTQGKSIEERLNDYHSDEPKADAVKQPVPVPSTEQKPAEVPTIPEIKTEDKPEASPKVEPKEDVELDEALANSKNPERTKAYIEKLQAKLREKEAKASEPQIPDSEVGGSVFDIFHPGQSAQPESSPAPAVPQGPMPSVATPFLNPLQRENIQRQFVYPDGTVDVDGMTRALLDADTRSRQLQQQVVTQNERIARIEESQQLKDAYAVYPELDPLKREGFDKDFFKLTRDRLVTNWANGKKSSLIEAASEVKQAIGKYQQPEKPQEIATKAVAQYKETQAARNQGPFETGRGEERTGDISYEELRKRTRMKGNVGDQALSERLKRAGI